MSSPRLSPAPDEEQLLLETVRTLSRALEAALPHLSPAGLRDVSTALGAEVRVLPDGRPLCALQPASVEEELRTAWASLGPAAG
ncbi:MAG: hypothetical protein U0529_22145 [Thermoanaerobaculia bacterium]